MMEKEICCCCGRLIDNYGGIEADDTGEVYCEECASEALCECDHCGRLVTFDNMLQVYNGEYVCRDCLDRFYTQCSNCGEYFLNNYTNYYDGEYYCDDCYDEIIISNAPISNYHHTYAHDFYKLDSEATIGNKFFGIELEIDDGNDNDYIANFIIDNTPEGYTELKEDSSLNYGFEIATQPSSYKYLLKNIDMFTTIFDKCISEGYRSHDTDTCGLHIHINRNFFDGITQREIALKVAYILYNNFDEFKKFSRRDLEKLNHWARILDLKVINNDDELYEMQKYNRYRAFNLSNSATYEFRLFRGTLNIDTFYATLELVDILTDFIKKESLEVCKLATFNEIFKNSSLNFYNYCKKRNINLNIKREVM